MLDGRAASTIEAHTGGAEPAGLPPAPTLRGALREALWDFYFHSLLLVAANLAWTAVLAVLVVVSLGWPLGALVLSPLLALPTAGMFRLADQVVRGQPSSARDAVAAWRRFGRRALGLGALVLGAGTVLAVNLAGGSVGGGMVGWSIATLAFWGALAGGAWALAAWVLLVDPARDGRPTGSLLRLAALLVLAFPARFGALTVVVAAILLASAVAFAALATVSVAFVALVCARYVLPASDRLEAALATRDGGPRGEGGQGGRQETRSPAATGQEKVTPSPGDRPVRSAGPRVATRARTARRAPRRTRSPRSWRRP